MHWRRHFLEYGLQVVFDANPLGFCRPIVAQLSEPLQPIHKLLWCHIWGQFLDIENYCTVGLFFEQAYP